MGLYVFTEFLKKEFSQENIQFWTECEKLKKYTDLDEVELLPFISKLFYTFPYRFVRKQIWSGQHIYMIQMMDHVESTLTVEHDKNATNHYYTNRMLISSKRLNLRYFNWWNSIHIRDFWNLTCIKNVLWVKWKANRYHTRNPVHHHRPITKTDRKATTVLYVIQTSRNIRSVFVCLRREKSKTKKRKTRNAVRLFLGRKVFQTIEDILSKSLRCFLFLPLFSVYQMETPIRLVGIFIDCVHNFDLFSCARNKQVSLIYSFVMFFA